MAKSSAKKSAKPAKPTKKPATKSAAKKPASRIAAKAAAKSAAKKPVLKSAKKSAPVKKPSGVKAAFKAVVKSAMKATSASKAPAKVATPVKAAAKASAKAAAKPTASKAAPGKAVVPSSKGPTPPKKPKKAYKPVRLPSGYKPTEKEEYMNPQQQEYFRQKLLGWRKELIEESRETLDHLHEENWHQADIADRASLETEAGVELRTRNRYLKLISKIDEAIKRIEEGEYGFCEETGEPIGLKRLEARPVATLSIEAQERHEKMERQYTDEE